MKRAIILSWTILIAVLFTLDAFGLTISEDFSSPTTNVTYNGNAFQDSGHAVLTPDTLWQAGSIWFHQSFYTNSFEVSFDFFVGSNASGADGITFAVIDESLGLNAIGVGGGNLGYYYIGGGPSFAVEFDTWDNGSSLQDPNGNHISAALHNSSGGLALLSSSSASAAIPVLEDGQEHNARISFNSNTAVVFLDNVDVFHVGYLESGIPVTGYFGFTGGTGAASNLQYVDNVVITGTPVPEPGTILLLGSGLVGLAGYGRKRRKA